MEESIRKIIEALDANVRLMAELKAYFLTRAEEEKAIQEQNKKKLAMLAEKHKKNARR